MRKVLPLLNDCLAWMNLRSPKLFFVFSRLPLKCRQRRIIRESLRLGKQVLVPLLDPGGENLQAGRIPSMDIDFVIGEYGVRQPAPKFRDIVPFSNIDFVVVPGLAFDNFRESNWLRRGIL